MMEGIRCCCGNDDFRKFRQIRVRGKKYGILACKECGWEIESYHKYMKSLEAESKHSSSEEFSPGESSSHYGSHSHHQNPTKGTKHRPRKFHKHKRRAKHEFTSDAHLTKETIKSIVYELSCPKCGQFDFSEVRDPGGRGIEVVKVCNHCHECVGIDATTGEDDLDNLLSVIVSNAKTSPCEECKNTDPFQYVFDDITGEKRIRCMVCNMYVRYEGQEPSSAEASIHQPPTGKFCAKCFNADPSQFMTDEHQRVWCMPCHEFMNSTITQGASGMKLDEDVPSKSSGGSGTESQMDLLCFCGGIHFDFRVPGDVTAQQDPTHAKCKKCGREHTLFDWLRFLRLGPNVATKSPPRSIVRDVSDLYPSDHIAWHRAWGNWDHAIVNQVGSGGIEIFKKSGESVEKVWVEADPESDLIYRHDYNPLYCFPADEVRQRAEEQVGKKVFRKYNLFNNGEHFATWCKTGKPSSSQLSNAVDAATSAVDACRTGWKVADLAQKVGRFGARAASKAGAAVMGVIELTQLAQKLHAHSTARDKGEIDQDMCLELQVEEVAKTATTALVTGLGVVSSVFLPVLPIVGMTVGYILGKAIAPAVGRGVVKLKRLFSKWWNK